MAKIIVVTSGKGGAGKTTVACYLGAKLAERGKRTVVCDLDFGLNNLDVVMGLEGKAPFDIGDTLAGRCRASQAIIESDAVRNLFMMSSGHVFDARGITGQNVKLLFEGLKRSFDYVLLDCPAGIDVGFHRAVSASDEALVVVTPSLASLRDADKVLTILRSYKLEKICAVVNLVRGDLMASGETLTVEQISSILKIKALGVISQDDAILLGKNCYLSPRTKAGKCFARLADNLISGKNKLPDLTREYFGIAGSIRRGLKKII